MKNFSCFVLIESKLSCICSELYGHHLSIENRHSDHRVSFWLNCNIYQWNDFENGTRSLWMEKLLSIYFLINNLFRAAQTKIDLLFGKKIIAHYFIISHHHHYCFVNLFNVISFMNNCYNLSRDVYFHFEKFERPRQVNIKWEGKSAAACETLH